MSLAFSSDTSAGLGRVGLTWRLGVPSGTRGRRDTEAAMVISEEYTNRGHGYLYDGANRVVRPVSCEQAGRSLLSFNGRQWME